MTEPSRAPESNPTSQAYPPPRSNTSGRTVAIGVGAAFVVAVLGAVAAFAVGLSTSDTISGTAIAMPLPVTVRDDVVRVGDSDAKVTVAVFEDLQCPYCQLFEAQSGRTLTGLMNTGTIAVDYHVIAFLDRASSTRYSSRAANAGRCVAAADKTHWPAWHKLMFEKQPKEGTAGLTDDELIGIAGDAGVTADITDCIKSDKHHRDIVDSTKKTLRSGLRGTPTVKIGDDDIEASPEGIEAAVAQATGR